MAKASEPRRTAYVVLERRVLREIDEPDEVAAWLPVLDEDQLAPKVFQASGRTAAIRQHTGDGAEVIEGDWKAVPLSSWKGGERTRRTIQAERLPLDVEA